jgi:hypothetical protein
MESATDPGPNLVFLAGSLVDLAAVSELLAEELPAPRVMPEVDARRATW